MAGGAAGTVSHPQDEDVPELTVEGIREALRSRAAEVQRAHEERELDHLRGLSLVRWNQVLR